MGIDVLRLPRLPSLAGLESAHVLDGLSKRVVALCRKGRALEILPVDAAAGAPIWQGEVRGPVCAARLGDSLLLALPGVGLLELRQDGDAVVPRLQPMSDPPDRIDAVGEDLWGIWLDPDRGGVGRVAGSDRMPLPELSRGQLPLRIARDGAGATILLAEDAELGFQAWYREDGRWRAATGRGAARHALNASVLAMLPRENGLLIAAGLTPSLESRLFHMPVRGEILRIRPDGCDIVCGELRTSPEGLMVPLAGAATPAAREAQGMFTHLAALGPAAAVAGFQRREGTVAFYRLDSAFDLAPLGTEDGLLLDLVTEGEGGAVALVLDLAEDAFDDEEEDIFAL